MFSFRQLNCIRILKPSGVFVADDALFPEMDLDSKWYDQVEPVVNSIALWPIRTVGGNYKLVFNVLEHIGT